MRKIPDRIALIGMRGSGKTTLGRQLAESFGLPLIDCDKELESRLGMSISEMFSQFGEPGFREKEAACLGELVQGDRWIMACGGGAILREANRNLLRERSFVIWLDAPPEILAERVTRDPWSASGRPPLIGADRTILQQKEIEIPLKSRPIETVQAELNQIFSDRKSLYSSTSHLRLATDKGKPMEWVEILKMELDKFQPEQGGF